MKHTKETLPIGARIRVYSECGKYIGHGTVEDHEWVASGFVEGFIAFIRLDNGIPMRIPFVLPAEVRLEVL